jgi:SAM-dependent methyltransferase
MTFRKEEIEMTKNSLTPAEVSAGWELGYQNHEGALWGEEAICILPDAVAALMARGIRSTVDVGCGDGRNLLQLCKHGLNCSGVDISATALMRAGATLGAHGQSAFLIESDLERLPFASGTVESLVCFDVFGQLPTPLAAVAEFARVLKPGGILFLNLYTPGDGTFGEGERIEERAFLYKGTLFRYYDESDVRGLFGGWDVDDLRLLRWPDPPHGDFRPDAHEHESWVLQVSAPQRG